MKVTLWGTRGSLASPGPETARYGGNTSCVEVSDPERLLVLDAGTGVRRLGMQIPAGPRRVDMLLTHMHLDHILGLGFFMPLFAPGWEVHIWGPGSTTLNLEQRLLRYLSPPFFPLHLHELASNLTLHEIAQETFDLGDFHIESRLVCHPGPTLGFRIEHASGASMAYLPDHEPALGVQDFPIAPEWTSGYDLARDVDLLIHDTQYRPHEYPDRQGWGHSTLEQAMAFGELAGVRRFMTFHYDPAHSDDHLDAAIAQAAEAVRPPFRVVPGQEGMTLDLGEK